MIDYEQVMGDWWHRRPPVGDSILDLLDDVVGYPLPVAYGQFLQWSNGGEGNNGHVYLMLWSAEDLAKKNADYEIAQDLPGKLAIGDNGPELIYLDECGALWSCDYGDRDHDDACSVSPSFESFISSIRSYDG